MNPEWRERAVEYADFAASKIPNGPAAGDLRRAASGSNEDLLLAIHLILERHEKSIRGPFGRQKETPEADLRAEVQGRINRSWTIDEARGRILCMSTVSAIDVREEGDKLRITLWIGYPPNKKVEGLYEKTFRPQT